MTEMTALPPTTDPRWTDIVMGKKTVNWELLAAKILMMRIVSSSKTDSSPENIKKCVEEIHNFFEKNLKLAQNDLKNMFA